MATQLHRNDRWSTPVEVPRGWRRIRDRAYQVRRRSAPLTEAFRDHALSWAAIGLVSAAFFQLSLFAGLLASGILVFLFELKISTDDGEQG